jgi:hypothetical protein
MSLAARYATGTVFPLRFPPATLIRLYELLKNNSHLRWQTKNSAAAEALVCIDLE